MTFIKGEKVKVDFSWYFSDEAVGCHDDIDIELARMRHHMDNRNSFCTIIHCNHPGSDDENYRVSLNDVQYNMDTKSIRKYRKIVNTPVDIV